MKFEFRLQADLRLGKTLNVVGISVQIPQLVHGYCQHTSLTGAA